MSSRFANMTARQRYSREYKECRMFNSYLNCDYGFEGDTARQNAYKSWCDRFATLPKMGRQFLPRVIERMVHDLMESWPTARNVRMAGVCHECEGQMMSFQLPQAAWRQSNQAGWEHCGYWCSNCGWSNAGSRPESVGGGK